MATRWIAAGVGAHRHVGRAIVQWTSQGVLRDRQPLHIRLPSPCRASLESRLALSILGAKRAVRYSEDLRHSNSSVAAPTGTSLPLTDLGAAPLVELAPVLVRRVGHHGRLILSGIASSVEKDVDRAYRRLGMQHVLARSRAGWSALVLQASW